MVSLLSQTSLPPAITSSVLPHLFPPSSVRHSPSATIVPLPPPSPTIAAPETLSSSMDDDRVPAGGHKKRAKRTEIPTASLELVAVGEASGSAVAEEALEEEAGAVIACSEEMEARIGQIFEKIEQFTQHVAEMLEAGKAMFKNLSAEFEERLIAIHREQIDKWEEEIRELRLLDASNEEAGALLQKARYHLLQNVQMDT